MEFPPLTQSLLKELVPCWLSRLPPCVQAVNLVAYNMANITVLLRGDIFFFSLSSASSITSCKSVHFQVT